MCLEIGEAKTSLLVMDSQVRFIRDQEVDEVPAKHLKVRCPCLKLIPMKYAYRCLYCGIFYCKECAEEHFGKTVSEYKEWHDKESEGVR